LHEPSSHQAPRSASCIESKWDSRVKNTRYIGEKVVAVVVVVIAVEVDIKAVYK